MLTIIHVGISVLKSSFIDLKKVNSIFKTFLLQKDSLFKKNPPPHYLAPDLPGITHEGQSTLSVTYYSTPTEVRISR